MASSWNGWGTSYFGSWPATFEEAPCTIQTEFFVAMWLPILPVKSVLVLSEKQEASTIIYQSKKLNIIEIEKFWPQIFNIYSVVALAIAITQIIMRAKGIKFSISLTVLIHGTLLLFPALAIIFSKVSVRVTSVPKLSILSLVIILFSFMVNIIS